MSYLADTVILLRYYEHRGEVRRALSVFKKRRGAHERTILNIEFSSRGIEIGQPLRQFRGINSVTVQCVAEVLCDAALRQ
jgi:circadian clock protein KaiC